MPTLNKNYPLLREANLQASLAYTEALASQDDKEQGQNSLATLLLSKQTSEQVNL